MAGYRWRAAAAGCLLLASDCGASGESPRAASSDDVWSEMGVPHLVQDAHGRVEIHWHGAVHELTTVYDTDDDAPQLLSLVGVGEVALFVEGTVNPQKGRLRVLAENGSVRTLAEHIVGIPIADPSTGVVAWTEKRGQGYGLVVYDAKGHRSMQRIELPRKALVSAVGDGRVFLMDTGRSTWRPGDEHLRPGRSPRAATEACLVTSAHPSAGLAWYCHDSFLQKPDGTEVPLPRDSVSQISPDGRYVAVTGSGRPGVFRTTDGRGVPMRLPRWDATLDWAQDGRLVIRSGIDGSDETRTSVCDVDRRRCRTLSVARWFGPRVQNATTGQFHLASPYDD